MFAEFACPSQLLSQVTWNAAHEALHLLRSFSRRASYRMQPSRPPSPVILKKRLIPGDGPITHNWERRAQTLASQVRLHCIFTCTIESSRRMLGAISKRCEKVPPICLARREDTFDTCCSVTQQQPCLHADMQIEGMRLCSCRIVPSPIRMQDHMHDEGGRMRPPSRNKQADAAYGWLVCLGKFLTKRR